MREQRSFAPQTCGTLYLVPTPIGNMDDLTLRALETLKKVDLLAAEDTRHTLKLCTHFDIHATLISYHEHNKRTSGDRLASALRGGKSVALVTDAGTPGISDPGADLVAECARQGIPVVPLPGPNAAVTALIASGLPTDHFLFYGFLPRQKKQRVQTLEALSALPYTLIFYESPFRVRRTLADLLATFGDRGLALARELTKRYETFIRGTIDEIVVYLDQQDEPPKGEICLIVGGAGEAAGAGPSDGLWWRDLDIPAHVDHYVAQRLPVKEAIRRTAADRALPKREVYQIYHHLDTPGRRR